MLISKKFSSALAYTACSAALLTMIGCSNDGSDQSGPAAQNQNQVTAAESQSAMPGEQNAQSARDFNGTTRGRVSEVNEDGSVVVLGQTISVSSTTVYFGVTRADIMVGDYISVESSIDSSGQVVAGAITLDTSFDSTVVLMGVIANVMPDEGTFQVGGVTIDFDSVDIANFDSANLANGMVVEIAADEQSFDDGFTQVSVDSISVLGNGNTVNIGPNGIVLSGEDTTGDAGDAGVDDVTITDDGGSTGGITIGGVDLEDMTIDTINDSIDEALALGDLYRYDYTDIKLAASSNCMSVAAPTTFQVTGETRNLTNQIVTHNLNEQVSVRSDSPDSFNLLAGDSTGLRVSMFEQDIAEVEIVAGDTTLTHYVGAIHDDVERPVVLTKQTGSWCSFIVFEEDTCTSITNKVTSTTLAAGQTVVDTSSSGTAISIDGEVIVDTESTQWLSANGMVDTVGNHSGVSVSGCELSNPINIPVITVE